MPEKFNPSSFSPFLEAVKKADASRSMGMAPKAEPAPISILTKLMDAPQRRVEAGSLLSASGLAVDAFAAALKQFEASGFVSSTTVDGQRFVVLESLGETVVRATV